MFGLGYVGAVTAACLVGQGHHVVGVDVNVDKVDRVSRGETPIIEPGLAELMRSGVDGGLIVATTDHTAALREADVALVTVGTPTTTTGVPDLGFVNRVMVQIAQGCSSSTRLPVIVLRSTVPPGTLDKMRCPLSGKPPRTSTFTCASIPEFLREGSAVRDFFANPPTR